MFHRSLEASTTTRILRTIFADESRFVVHDPLPGGGQFADEGAANHIRLATSAGAAHVFAWGRRAWGAFSGPRLHPARQTHEASMAIARLHGIDPASCVFPQQHPDGIDRGAFHTDVLAVGNGHFFLYHELAFAEESTVLRRLRELLGDELVTFRATSDEIPVEGAVAAYPFNSQILTLADGSMAIVAPEDSREDASARALFDRVVASEGPVRAVHFIDVRESMNNGGGPACLRLRVPMTDEETRGLAASVLLDDALDEALVGWVGRNYRDRLVPADLADRDLAREGMRALDELTQLLKLGPVYDFQK
jgi:succinylarginine dihydrolase